MYIPDQGHIVSLNFDPSSGKEIMKRRPAFVLSRKAFNEHTGFAIVAPITSTVRGMKLEVLISGHVVGAVLPHQQKSLDYKSQNIEFIEIATEEITATVVKYAQLIIS